MHKDNPADSEARLAMLGMFLYMSDRAQPSAKPLAPRARPPQERGEGTKLVIRRWSAKA